MVIASFYQEQEESKEDVVATTYTITQNQTKNTKDTNPSCPIKCLFIAPIKYLLLAGGVTMVLACVLLVILNAVKYLRQQGMRHLF